MRPLEILLLVANLMAFFLLIVPLPPGVRWLRHLALIPLLAMGAQLLVEGPRWQMVPAYALSCLFSLVWLLRTVKPAGWGVERPWIRRLAAGLGVGLGAVVLAVSIALPIILPVFNFPQPTGPYEIGRLTYHWVDADRPEILTADPGDHRELMVDIWYPAKGDPSAPHAPYMPDAHAVAPALADLFGLPGFAFRHLEYVTTHAIASAPVAEDQPSYPVLIYMEGGSAIAR